jgi:acetylornithine deacetylase
MGSVKEIGGLTTLAKTLVDIDSTTGREAQLGQCLVECLSDRGYIVNKQPVSEGRFNVFASLNVPPRVVFSTHFDCVPPFFPSRQGDGILFGRGTCDAKGILASQIVAGDRLRALGEERFGLLFLVGEERGSDGARVANQQAPTDVLFLINGEPTDNRLGSATRGTLRINLKATGRAAHSSFPELGESAIDKLLDALMVIRGLTLPEDPLLGRTHYSVGLIEGGVAPNVISPLATAELLFRTVGEGCKIVEALKVVEGLVTCKLTMEVPTVRMHTVPGFETAVFPYTTDVPLLTQWGRPLLLGPGSIHVAHTDNEHVSSDELHEAVDCYVTLAQQLLKN